MKTLWRMKGLRNLLFVTLVGTATTLVIGHHASPMIFHDMIAILLGFVFGAPIGILTWTGWWLCLIIEHGNEGNKRRADLRKLLDDYDAEHEGVEDEEL